MKTKPRRRFALKRWAIFAVAVGIVSGTLLAMIWTGENGKAVHLTFPHQKGSKHGWSLVIASNFGYLDARVSHFIRVIDPPLITFSTYKSVRIIDRGIPYTAIIGVQCVALFFLAPSVLTRRKRESPTD